MNTNTNDTPQPASATRPDCAPPTGSRPFWPCPHRCDTWARCEPIDLTKPMPNHHSKCEHYNASLMDVWVVTYEGQRCLYDDAPLPEALEELEGATVEKIQMHREVFEATPEFTGW